MRSVKERPADEPSDVHPTKRPCNAFGCPEIGAISHTNAGPAPADSWFCRWHFGESADRWPEITMRRRLARESQPFPDDPPKVDVTPEYIASVRAELARFAKRFGRA